MAIAFLFLFQSAKAAGFPPTPPGTFWLTVSEALKLWVPNGAFAFMLLLFHRQQAQADLSDH
jgi:hypothetical protein